MEAELPIVRYGGGSRRVLLIHGTASNAGEWQRLGPELANRGWSVTAPTLPGHGDAPDIGSYALDHLAALLVSIGSGWDVVVGHSLGGALALVAAARPGFARSVVAIDPPLARADWSASRDAMLRWLTKVDERTTRAAHPGWSDDDVRHDVTAARLVRPAAVRAIFDDNAPWDLRHVVAGLTVPVDLVSADPAIDATLDPAIGRSLAALNPLVEWRLAPGCGHCIQREDPVFVLDAIERAFARRPVP